MLSRFRPNDPEILEFAKTGIPPVVIMMPKKTDAQGHELSRGHDKPSVAEKIRS